MRRLCSQAEKISCAQRAPRIIAHVMLVASTECHRLVAFVMLDSHTALYIQGQQHAAMSEPAQQY